MCCFTHTLCFIKHTKSRLETFLILYNTLIHFRKSVKLQPPAVQLGVVLLPACLEGDLLAVHLALERHRPAFGAQRAAEHLELLLERELALRGLPGSADARRHDPHQRGAPVAVA